MSARRCPNCGGLVGADVEWCGQCLRRLDRAAGDRPGPRGGDGGQRRPAVAEGRNATVRPEGAGAADEAARPAPSGSEGGPIRAQGEAVVWTCPSCGTDNPLEETACAACGTPFRRLFEEAEQPRTPAPPTRRAVGLSMAFPGAGHIASGRVGEGVARAVVFAYAMGTALAVLVGRGARDLGPFLPLVLVLVLAAAVVYVVTAIDARRLGRGEAQLVTTRMLLYGATGLMVLTVLVLVVSGLRITRF